VIGIITPSTLILHDGTSLCNSPIDKAMTLAYMPIRKKYSWDFYKSKQQQKPSLYRTENQYAVLFAEYGDSNSAFKIDGNHFRIFRQDHWVHCK
jgi:hypothetical protein